MMKVLVLLSVAVCALALPSVRRNKRQAEEDPAALFCQEQLALTPVQMFFADPADCSHYYQCFQNGAHLIAANKLCPTGQIWDQAALTCKLGSCEGVDPCTQAEVESEGYYASEESCAEFFQCNHGASVRQCCPHGLGWNQTAYMCDDVTPCTLTCDVVPQELETESEELELEDGQCRVGDYIYAAGASPAVYTMIPVVQDEDTVAVQGFCPVAAPIFDVAHCGCTGHDPTIFTESGSCLTFDYEDAITPGQPAWVDVFGVEIIDGAMCFKDHAYLQVPYYSAMDWTLGFSVSFKFTVEGDLPGDIQTFVSNGNVNSPASVLVQLNDGEVQVVLIPYRVTPDQACTVALPAAAPGGEVTVTYDGKPGGAGITLRVGEEESTELCTGAVKQTPNPVYLGRDFVGCMDEVKICTQL